MVNLTSRTKWLRMRLNEEEYAQVERAAQLGFQSVGKWCRGVILANANGQSSRTQQSGGAEALINPDGTYAVASGVVVGDYLIEISPLMHIVDTDPGKSPPAPMEKPAPDIPKKYRMQGTSPLKATVKAGKNEINFDMQP